MYSTTTILGRVCRDIELRTTPNGVSVASFTVAVDRQFSKEKQADYYNVVAWRQQAEFVSKHFSKGSPILVQGTMQSRKYTDKNDIERTTWELVADRVSFTGNPPGGSSTGTESQQEAGSTDDSETADFAEIEDDGGLPF